MGKDSKPKAKAGDSKGGGKDNKKKDDNKDNKKEEVKGAQQLNVRHILCEKHSKKEEALAKIRAGEKFDDVAREFSEDKARQGGSLGWKAKGTLDAKFEAIAYGLPNSTTANPTIGEAKTENGYHIIMVEGRK
ncbi:peptidyl-prolyl cis-trans isomerase PIN4 [Apodospora peruviana]|uniref:Peptidyl-prolyl cis-trans isomerase n=1 Tax=Apodospora peruviana TaxID=516989 RepID=A0AAE0ICY8_9PEZI|nr:peptidyl-prolyl cis-trans isomerase PIN4 [Apodospora peruviana]